MSDPLSSASAKPWLWRLAKAVLALAGFGLLSAPAARAEPAQVQIIPQSELSFGTFAVPTRGFREVSASGAVTSSGIFALSDTGTGPARFTVQYDRGNNGRKRLDLVIELVFSAAPVFNNGGVVAQLSRYQTDLPGYGVIEAGQVIRIEMPNCLQRVCSRTFNVGGRLDIDRSFGGARVAIPIPVNAVLVSVR